MARLRDRLPSAASLLLLACLSLLGLSGCAHYSLGTGATEPLAFSTLYVEPVSNEAALPQAVALVTRELRTALLRDGRVTLAPDAASADAVLSVNLFDYGRTLTAVQPNDTALARKFDLALGAQCTLVNQRTGEPIFKNRTVRVTRQIFVDDGQNPAEYQALPHLADQLADWVAHAVLDVW
ncbi:LPS assembly lipoprotein LptE [Actomonas aquatica]|uniref:LPS assembly lipoprotein LptE n=1 Tax=Actomonas aquatica TaxID=2866162 RepID=A0ABZ1C8B3_9BACT|nr:LPS assembly lipoprotein LptE [Opitutus sp. WL0086]WRQ87929.1 LPS assembly lipoprotein LptE [Opitutus sp. WL0086]